MTEILLNPSHCNGRKSRRFLRKLAFGWLGPRGEEAATASARRLAAKYQRRYVRKVRRVAGRRYPDIWDVAARWLTRLAHSARECSDAV